jgi:hypothetical protein
MNISSGPVGPICTRQISKVDFENAGYCFKDNLEISRYVFINLEHSGASSKGSCRRDKGTGKDERLTR